MAGPSLHRSRPGPGRPPAAGPNAATEPADRAAPDFSLLDSAGKKVSLADYAGKIVVLEWLNPECLLCQRYHANRTMESLAEKYAPKGVAWLLINSSCTWTVNRNKAWADKQKLPYPMLDDSLGKVGHLYGVKTTPEVVIVDPARRIAYAGAVDDNPSGKAANPTNYIPKALDELLAGRAVSTPRARGYGCPVRYGVPPPAAPAFTLKDQAGKPVSLDHAGKIVVLEWINPECPFSARHHAKRSMESLAEKYAPKGVVWLAVNSTHTWNVEKNKAWADKQKLPYPMLDDSGGQVGRLYEAKTTPDMRIIDTAGRIVYVGGIDDDPLAKEVTPVNYVAKALDELLAGESVATPRTRPYGCSVKYAPIMQ